MSETSIFQLKKRLRTLSNEIEEKEYSYTTEKERILQDNTMIREFLSYFEYCDDSTSSLIRSSLSFEPEKVYIIFETDDHKESLKAIYDCNFWTVIYINFEGNIYTAVYDTEKFILATKKIKLKSIYCHNKEQLKVLKSYKMGLTW